MRTTTQESAIDPAALALLRCPVTHEPLRALTECELAATNACVAAGELRRLDGHPVRWPLQAGLVSADGSLGYELLDGIAMLLGGLAIALEPGAAASSGGVTLRPEKRSVQAFYDEVGWTTTDDGELVDTALFLDRRPVVREYNAICRRRVQSCLAPGGRFLLDVASGPVQFAEYRAYGDAFQTRICVDLSFAALVRARRNIGERGVFVMGDITNLPLADDAVDAVVSLHTIYHVPHDEQATAFREVHRVLKPGCTAVVAYSWQTIPWGERSLPMRIALLPPRLVGRAWRFAATWWRRLAGEADREPPRLYFHAHDRRWFERQKWPFEAEIFVWSMLSQQALRRFVHRRLLAGVVLGVVRRIEDRWPHLAGRIGRYPLIVIRKM